MIKAVRLNLLDSILRKIESVSSSVIAVKWEMMGESETF
jgi:hypothetical protein